ncbi:hypothetical protein GCM10010421_55020 [Streptomyces glaucus]|uniref:Secreted protein n=1 Tax=Streptomyces glaucus TaxID=284029 RepID=A0ABN3KBC9_9ACTN
MRDGRGWRAAVRAPYASSFRVARPDAGAHRRARRPVGRVAFRRPAPRTDVCAPGSTCFTAVLRNRFGRTDANSRHEGNPTRAP